MRYPFALIKQKHTEDLSLSEEEFLKKRRGEILHFTLSLITYLEDKEDLLTPLKKAFAFFGEREELWDISGDMLLVLKRLFSLENCSLFFPQKKMAPHIKILKERSFFSSDRILRPDRVVLYPEKAVVVEFKSHLPDKETRETYHLQAKGYCKIISKIYQKPTEGYLLYLQPLGVERVGNFDEKR